MAAERLVRLLRKGPEAWATWRQADENRYYNSVKTKRDGTFYFPDHEIDLTSADLRCLKLRGVDLSLTNLRNVDFRGATLDDIDFSHSDLRGARFAAAKLDSPKFIETDLAGADFTRASVENAEFADADLTGARFKSANIEVSRFGGSILKGVDFTGAYIGAVEFSPRDFSDAILKAELDSCVFLDTDLSQVKGLAYARHGGPSTIGIDTFYRSKGRVPKRFLLNAGVPVSFVQHTRSLLKGIAGYYSCFISHSSKDKRFCDLLVSRLRRRGIPLWYFPENAKWGRGVWKEIDPVIHMCDKLILVCSMNSLRSGPVLREIERALQREQ